MSVAWGKQVARMILGAAVALGGAAGCGDDAEDAPDGEDDSSGQGGASGEDESPARFEYEPVEGARCGNGSEHGVGVSEGGDATSLVLFLNGGGACWDALTCFGLSLAAHVEDDYDESLFERELAPLTASGLTDRRPGATPFADATLVFVPYCTGDLFSGDVARDYTLGGDTRTIHHVGRQNLRAVAAHLKERFPEVRQVWLVGASAGGYGALLNYELLVEGLGEARIDVLVDGAPFVEPSADLLATWRSQWQVEGPDCEGCDSSLGAVLTALHAAHPERRFGLVTSQNDEVVRAFFGHGLTDLTPRVDALVDAHYELPNAKAFVVPGVEHVLLGGYRTRRGPGDVPLRDYVDGWAEGDERFVTVRP